MKKDTQAGYIHSLFSSVAPCYDVMNDAMSLGLHRLWKKRLVEKAAPLSTETFLDLAGGTGDVAISLSGLCQRVLVVDSCQQMVQEGKKTQWDKGCGGQIEWIVGTAEALPLRTRSVEACVMSFGLRNVECRQKTYGEILRILKPGGRFFCLEFSPVDTTTPFGTLYHLWGKTVIPFLGQSIANNEDAYRYLVKSIALFPPPCVIAEELRKASFEAVEYESMAGGIVNLHSGTKKP